MRGGWLFHGVRLHAGIAACACGNPAPRQPGQRVHGPGARDAGRATGVGHHGAQVALLGIAPAQRHTRPGAPARHQHAQRARRVQTAQAAAIAGRALGRLRGGVGVPVNDVPGRWQGRLLGCHVALQSSSTLRKPETNLP